MGLFKALHHFLNPHCPDCRAEHKELREEEKEDLQEQRVADIQDREEVKVCDSCQTLLRQLEIANNEKQQLLDRLLNGPPKEHAVVTDRPISMPRSVPWNVRRQMLEAEDRRKAQLTRDAIKPDNPVVQQANVSELEKELGVDDGTGADNKETEDKVAQG